MAQSNAGMVQIAAAGSYVHSWGHHEEGGSGSPEDCEDAPLVVNVDFVGDPVGMESSNPHLVHSSTTDWTVVEDGGVKYYESTGSQTNLKVEFPSTITLANGEALRVKVDYQYTSPPTAPGTQLFNFLRFGAYDDQGTPNDYRDDIGYLADVSYWQQDTDPSATKTGDYAVRREDNFYNDFDLGPLLDNLSVTDFGPPLTPETGDIVTMTQASGMSATWPKPFDEGTSAEHAAVLCLVNVDGTLEARLFHGFPVTYIGSGVESGEDVQLSFNSLYLESPSDNNGFRVRRIAAQHVPDTMNCCEPDMDTPDDPSDCIVIVYDDRDDGPAGGGEPDPLATGWSYPNAQAEQAKFLNDLSSFGLSYELITFEHSNGWSPVNGLGDMFAGAGAPYAGGANTSAAMGAAGSMASGDAAGSVAYYGADNTVAFSLYANGHMAGIDEPGIGDMDGSNDTDRGVNTTPGGYHFLEVLPSEKQPGGLHIEFNIPVPAVGMYLMGVEDEKRDIEVVIVHADGTVQIRSADVSEGPNNEGGIQFVGYRADDLEDITCWIKSITFNELYDGEPPSERDIFAVDDVIYPAREMNPPVDDPEDCEDAPLVVNVDFVGDPVGMESSNPHLVHSSTTDWTVVEDGGVKYYESTGSQTNLKVEFPSTITLANGEALRVKVDYQYTSPPTAPGTQLFNFLRFGAYDDQGTPNDYRDDIGYLADVSYWQQDTDPSATKTGDYAVRREDNFYNDFDLGPLLDNLSVTDFGPPLTPETGDIVTMTQASGMSATWPKPFDEGTSAEHAAVLCLVNVDGTLEARLFHGFPVTYIGSGVESGEDVQLSFNSLYLESPSDNNGFRVRRIAAQHVPDTMNCCEPDMDTPDMMGPVITLIGGSLNMIEVGSSDNDQGAAVTDKVEPDSDVYVQIHDGSASVDQDSIALVVNGEVQDAVVQTIGGVTSVTVDRSGLLWESGEEITAELSYVAGGETRDASWHWTVIDFVTLPTIGHRSDVGTGVEPGFAFRVHQIDTVRANSTPEAEAQLAGERGANLANSAGGRPSNDPSRAGTVFDLDGVINMDQNSGSVGYFRATGDGSLRDRADGPIPGIPGTTGNTDNIAAEILTYVEFPEAGYHRMVFNSDDGFRVTVGHEPGAGGIELGVFNGGRGASDTIFGFAVAEPGLYPLRAIWYEGGGGANLEWSSFVGDDRILINDSEGGLKAYRTRDGAVDQGAAGRVSSITRSDDVLIIEFTGVLKSSDTVNGPYEPVAGAMSPFSVTPDAGQRFFIAQ